ncbi:ABC transporter substrate-binding protein [Deinococcus deserti]|uniref:Putative amino acid ABC transporter, periplasmic component n=1 Tax=Deinococcus deserti (strain DSM 17065 / CIP 109153 / LMG 22923 / VCD115) TaxID=546414 RepID=C1D437_DEIDV|nr:ABC transporter substrate-binding protein [Deinococcus deserti]ACO47918.1 putative amino acid ABC transporter, periplasmic component [Deinococcus deserti VCD115]
MRLKISLLAGLALMVGSAAQARTLSDIKASGVLKVATSADFEPFNYMKGGVAKGFEVDLAEQVARQMGLRIEWVVRPFDGLLKEVNDRPKEIDVVIASHAINSTRAKTVEFASPHYCTGGVILTRKGGPLTTKALAGKKLGAEAGSTYFSFLRKLPFDKSVQVYNSSLAVTTAVATGQVAAIVTDRFAAIEAQKTFPKAGLVLGETLWKEQIAMAFAKGNTELKTAVNAALHQVETNGGSAQLSRKYFGQNIGC